MAIFILGRFGLKLPISATPVLYANSLFLPIRERVKFKVACLVPHSLSRQAPLHLADDCCLASDRARRSLRSADVPTCVLPRTLSSNGDRTFAAAGPRLWNSLLVQLHKSRHHLRTVQTTAEGGALEKHLLTYLLTLLIIYDEHRSVCLVYVEHGEDDINAADAGDAGCVHPFITGC